MRQKSKLLPALLAAAAVGLLASAYAAEPKKPTRVSLPTVNVNKDKAERCVEPTEVMRRDHMNMILHQRDETMHQGIRTVKHSLKNCVDCHADPKTGRVLGQNGFCESCHTYAAVTMDCFGCHTDKAEKKTGAVRTPDTLEKLVRLSAMGSSRGPRAREGAVAASAPAAGGKP